jgi:hypothetical protein
MPMPQLGCGSQHLLIRRARRPLLLHTATVSGLLTLQQQQQHDSTPQQLYSGFNTSG